MTKRGFVTHSSSWIFQLISIEAKRRKRTTVSSLQVSCLWIRFLLSTFPTLCTSVLDSAVRPLHQFSASHRSRGSVSQFGSGIAPPRPTMKILNNDIFCNYFFGVFWQDDSLITNWWIFWNLVRGGTEVIIQSFEFKLQRSEFCVGKLFGNSVTWLLGYLVARLLHSSIRRTWCYISRLGL